MFINIISILLVLLFAYGLIRNFRLGNYAYAFVMYVGMIIFYANLYHNIGSGVSLYLMMLAIFAAIICAIIFIYRAVEADNSSRHYWGVVALSVLTLLLILLFKFLL